MLAPVGCGGDDDEAPSVAVPERIVFASNRDGDFEIYSMKPDGSDVAQLTRNETTADTENDDWAPSWSPDGRMIAFTSTRDHEGDGTQSQELYVMNADGTDQRRLTDEEPNVNSAGWTADGRIGYLSCTGGISDCELRAISPESGESEVLHRSKGPTEFVSLTPDGDRLAITTFDPEASALAPRVELADLDGGDRELLLEDGGEPDWSADGERVAFVSWRDDNGHCLFHDCTGSTPEVYVADADGGDQRRITRTEGQETGPRWSPDGKKLLFARIDDEEDDYQLFVVNADGSCERELTKDDDGWDWMADWIGPDAGEALRC